MSPIAMPNLTLRLTPLAHFWSQFWYSLALAILPLQRSENKQILEFER